MAAIAALRFSVGYVGSWVAGWFIFSLDHAPRAEARLWFFVRQGALGSQSSFASCNMGSYSVFRARWQQVLHHSGCLESSHGSCAALSVGVRLAHLTVLSGLASFTDKQWDEVDTAVTH
jgi:fluoride ion exporter CrcB/FEX